MLDDAKYRITEVARICGVPENTIKTHLHKRQWFLGATDMPGLNCGPHHITLRRALQIALAFELMRNGIDPVRAYEAALCFSDEADPAEWQNHGVQRLPGELFPSGQTILILRPGQSHAVVRRFDNDTPMHELVFSPASGFETERSGTFVWVNPIDLMVRDGLAKSPGRAKRRWVAEARMQQEA